jgi:SAM-dependent methyltransferase
MNHEQYWGGFFDDKAGKESDEAKCLTFSSEANRQSIYEAIHCFIEGPFDNILDAGAGTASICKRYGTQSSFITALDISFEMLKKIQRTDTAGSNRIDLCQASVLNPPFCELSFDLVIASEVLQYVPFLPSVQRLIALLKNQGVLIISVPHENHPAIQRANRRREGLFNGIGIKELKVLSELDAVSFLYMPLFLGDDKDKRLKHSQIFAAPETESLNSANRFILKLE